MKTKSKRPYFVWDYDLTEADIRRMLAGKNEMSRQWAMARILGSAGYRDVWKYLTLPQIIAELPKLRMRPAIKNYWQHAVDVWTGHDTA